MTHTIETGESQLISDEVLWRKDGSPIAVEYQCTPIIKNGGIAGAVVTFSDITARKLAEEQLERQAFYDMLTDLPNRRLLQDRLEQAIAHAERHGHKGALLFLDLDHFKTINDSLGHAVGDAMLQQVAVRLASEIRHEDTAARMGGDEFVLLLPEVTGEFDTTVSRVQEVADKLRLRLTEPFFIGEHLLHVTPSIGIALFPSRDASAEDVLKQADAAMYRAKEGGRNGVQFFLPSMQRAVEEKLTIQNDLRYALELGELQLHYQPQCDAEGRLLGAEALLRWQHPQRGLIPPDEFIPVAEETGQILHIGEWVLQQSCALITQCNQHYGPDVLPAIAVNVSPRQFRQSDFVQTVRTLLQQFGLEGRQLELELTEGMLLDDVADTSEKIRQLRQEGVRFAVDDFGTGYSSLAYLKDLPLNKLKIDKSFISNIKGDGEGDAIVTTIIAMTRHLGLEVIAEGVENSQQLAFLQQGGCHSYQGYYFSRPLPEEQFLAVVEQRGPGGPEHRG